jgi:hypothetical protein
VLVGISCIVRPSCFKICSVGAPRASVIAKASRVPTAHRGAATITHRAQATARSVGTPECVLSSVAAACAPGITCWIGANGLNPLHQKNERNADDEQGLRESVDAAPDQLPTVRGTTVRFSAGRSAENRGSCSRKISIARAAVAGRSNTFVTRLWVRRDHANYTPPSLRQTPSLSLYLLSTLSLPRVSLLTKPISVGGLHRGGCNSGPTSAHLQLVILPGLCTSKWPYSKDNAAKRLPPHARTCSFGRCRRLTTSRKRSGTLGRKSICASAFAMCVITRSNPVQTT